MIKFGFDIFIKSMRPLFLTSDNTALIIYKILNFEASCLTLEYNLLYTSLKIHVAGFTQNV